jgi:hypothetical protein
MCIMCMYIYMYNIITNMIVGLVLMRDLPPIYGQFNGENYDRPWFFWVVLEKPLFVPDSHE